MLDKNITYTAPRVKRKSKLFENMLEQTHLLIAGATGSGKSVVINGMVATILTRSPLNARGGARMILIDPKRVELAAYKHMPHTMRYASEPAEMMSALRYAMSVTEKRFQAMSEKGIKKHNGSDVYVIIDEFADLMTTQPKSVVPLIQRLAQIGRAARVHIILATQTPISEILPTKIKCNFDSRIGLRTRSAQDSRNIIGKTGLETLPRYGSGYYMTPDGEDFCKIPYVSDAMINTLVRWWMGPGQKRAY